MKIGRIKIEEIGETYGIISVDGKKIITKQDFQEIEYPRPFSGFL